MWMLRTMAMGLYNKGNAEEHLIVKAINRLYFWD